MKCRIMAVGMDDTKSYEISEGEQLSLLECRRNGNIWTHGETFFLSQLSRFLLLKV